MPDKYLLVFSGVGVDLLLNSLRCNHELNINIQNMNTLS